MQSEESFMEEYGKRLGFPDRARLGSFPDFLIISTGKTGSSYLFDNCRCHDDIYIPPQKEVHYFDLLWRRLGIDWYLKLFQDGACLIKGEATPNYAFLPSCVIKTISEIKPDLKLIFLMRDPVARAWSHAKHNYRYREFNFHDYDGDSDSIPEWKFIENLSDRHALAQGDYLGMLTRWTEFFPQEQFYVGFYESIIDHPQKLMQEIFGHLGVKKSVDWSMFKIAERINGGMQKAIPENLKHFLRFMWKERTNELVSYLRDKFNIIDIPSAWNNTLCEEEPTLVEKDYMGFDIVSEKGQLRGRPVALRDDDVNRVEMVSLEKRDVTGMNIYDIRQ